MLVLTFTGMFSIEKLVTNNHNFEIVKVAEITEFKADRYNFRI